MKTYYEVAVVYPSKYSHEYDSLIRKAAGIYGDSGSGFGIRDIEFNFNTEEEARRCKTRIKDLKLDHVRVKIAMLNDDGENIGKIEIK